MSSSVRWGGVQAPGLIKAQGGPHTWVGEREQASPGGYRSGGRNQGCPAPYLGGVRSREGNKPESRFPAELCDLGGTQGATKSQAVLGTHCRSAQVS